MNNDDKPVFVTGGTGLVGSHLIFKLITEGKKVRALHRKTSNREFLRKVFGYYSDQPDLIYNCVEWVECDILNYDRLSLVINGCAQVYHCAAAVSFESGQSETLLKNNIQGTANIVRACLENKTGKLCHVSSTAALGASNEDKPVTEEHEWRDEDYHAVYAVSKHLSEEEVWKGIRKGLNAVIVNPSVIFGPGDWDKGSSSFFSNIYSGMLFYSRGVTGYVDVNDVVTAMVILMERPVSGERFIVSSENLSFQKIFSLIAQSLKVKEPSVYIPSQISYPLYYMSQFASKLTGRKSPLTKETIKAAYSKVFLDNSRVLNETGMTFTPVEKTIATTAAIFLSENRAEKK